MGRVSRARADWRLALSVVSGRHVKCLMRGGSARCVSALEKQAADQEVPNVIIGPFYTNLAMMLERLDIPYLVTDYKVKPLLRVPPSTHPSDTSQGNKCKSKSANSTALKVIETSSERAKTTDRLHSSYLYEFAGITKACRTVELGLTIITLCV